MSYTLLYLISISRQAFKSVHIYLKEYIRLRLRMGNLVSYLYKGKLKEIPFSTSNLQNQMDEDEY